jgi:hypothetical protein
LLSSRRRSKSEELVAAKKYFRKLRDPRVQGRKRRPLLDIVAITICATVCGRNDWQQVETFARARQGWLRKLLRLSHGVPSHDNFERVFELPDPQQFQAYFRDWMHALH